MEYRDEKNTCIQSQVTDKTVSFEQNGELSLPDYLGEVSRLLWVRPTILPPARFLNGGNAEFFIEYCKNNGDNDENKAKAFHDQIYLFVIGILTKLSLVYIHRNHRCTCKGY